jgi:hypothetical protein
LGKEEFDGRSDSQPAELSCAPVIERFTESDRDGGGKFKHATRSPHDRIRYGRVSDNPL